MRASYSARCHPGNEDQGRYEEEELEERMTVMLTTRSALHERCTEKPSHEELLGRNRHGEHESWEEKQKLQERRAHQEAVPGEKPQAERRHVHQRAGKVR